MPPLSLIYDFDIDHWTELPKYFGLFNLNLPNKAASCSSALTFNKEGKRILMVLMWKYGKI